LPMLKTLSVGPGASQGPKLNN